MLRSIRLRSSLNFIRLALAPLLLAVLVQAGSWFLTGSLHADDSKLDFNRDIRPLLAENCFHCHGPDAGQRQADLRLDTEAGARMIIPAENPLTSELLTRVRSTDPELQMPPPDSKRTLTAAQITLLEQWLTAGAPWGVHWSFSPLTVPAVPNVASSLPGVFQRNPIDAFIQHKLQQQGLTPAPEADRRTLLRRLSLDLTGLPPNPKEVAEFLNDPDPQAYERQVERLLNSPAYGERMAWDWLDAARYADSNGYQGDNERTMWPWRDWVVKAFNENLPYDQFTIWQLAGDQLPEPTFEQQLATGFCRNYMINGEGGRIAEENRVDYVMDMSETMGTVWLGLTLNCCRCHDHKFDPLTKDDYYGLFAFFNQTPVNGGGGDPQTAPVIEAPTVEQQSQLDALKNQLAAIQVSLQSRSQELNDQQAAWELAQQAQLESSDPWTTLQIQSAVAVQQTLEVQPAGTLFASGPNPANDTYTLTATTMLPQVSSIRLEALRDPTHTHGGLARSDSGNFVLTEFELSIQRGPTAEPQRIPFASAQATFEQGELKIAKTFDGNPGTGWAVHEGKPVDREHAAIFQLAEPLTLAAGDTLTFVLRHDSPHPSHNLGRFRLLLSANKNEDLVRPSGELLAALKVPTATRNAGQQQLVRDAFLKADTTYQQLLTEQQNVEKQQTDVRKSIPKVMVMQDLAKPRETFLLDRGLYNQPGAAVVAHTPVSLPPLPSAGATNRLALAQWLVSDEHPLTARVTVNRFWQQVFGIGLVKTTEDFGSQGEVPVHLELLNWLAYTFREDDWDVKQLMRLIVTSHTYRQSSQVTPHMLEHDPLNRLLGRAPRFRMPFWMVRDQALAASGLLVSQTGGPPVNGYQPTGVWEEATFGNKKYTQDHGPALYRRSLYTFWRRIVAPTMFFDSATRQTCNVKVARTNTPLQSLLTQNDITYIEAARLLAEQALLANAVDDAARLNFIFERLLTRPATAAEQAILLAGLNRSRTTFEQQPEAVAELLKQGEFPRNESLHASDHAAWTTLCLALLNLDETLSKE